MSSPNSFTTATGISKGVESAVWNVAADGTLTISWVNTDGSVNSDLTIVRNQSDDFFMAVGDLSATEDEFGSVFTAVVRVRSSFDSEALSATGHRGLTFS